MSRFGKVENDLNWTTKRGPPTVVCYICGRAFGTASISIHIPQCAKKFENEQLNKPKSERRPLPQAPAALPAGGSYTHEDIDAFNEAASRQYKDTACISCEYCGRNFKDDRTLVIHHRSCSSDRPAKKVGEKLVGGGGALSSLSPARRLALQQQQQVTSSKEDEDANDNEEEVEEDEDENELIRATKRRDALQKWVVQQNREGLSGKGGKGGEDKVVDEPSAMFKKVSLSKRSAPLSTGSLSTSNNDQEWKTSLLERFSLLNERFDALQAHVMNETALLKGELADLVDELTNSKE